MKQYERTIYYDGIEVTITFNSKYDIPESLFEVLTDEVKQTIRISLNLYKRSGLI